MSSSSPYLINNPHWAACTAGPFLHIWYDCMKEGQSTILGGMAVVDGIKCVLKSAGNGENKRVIIKSMIWKCCVKNLRNTLCQYIMGCVALKMVHGALYSTLPYISFLSVNTLIIQFGITVSSVKKIEGPIIYMLMSKNIVIVNYHIVECL